MKENLEYSNNVTNGNKIQKSVLLRMCMPFLLTQQVHLEWNLLLSNMRRLLTVNKGGNLCEPNMCDTWVSCNYLG